MRMLTFVLVLVTILATTSTGWALPAPQAESLTGISASGSQPRNDNQTPGDSLSLPAEPGTVGSGGSSPDSRRPTARIPVVLVHGAFSSSEQAWGKPSDPGGFHSFLCGIGYEPDITLFTVDYRDQPDGDYAALYPAIHQAVSLARARSGHRRVDIVTHSMGSLMARYYVNSPSYDGGVRTLVMMNPPNEGSFAAMHLRSAFSLVAQEERRRGQPALQAAVTGFPEFRGETDYVAKRAAGFYEPLYEQFLLETRVLTDTLPAAETFEDWLAATMPDSFRKCFTQALEPPVTPDWDPGDAPAQGKDLARAYYEMLGLQAGRHNYVRFKGSGKTLLDSIMGSAPPVSTDLKQIIKDYATRALFYLAGRLVELSVTTAKSAAVAFIESRWSISLDSPALRRLIPVDVTLLHDDPPLLANHFLNRWAAMEASERRTTDESDSSGLHGWPRNVRYVVIAGSAMLANGPWARGAGENDGLVQVESAFLPLRSDDVFRVFRGVVWPNHVALSGNPTVRRYIASQLESYYPVHARHVPSFRTGWLKWMHWSEGGSVQVTPWEASYVAVDASRLGQHDMTLRIELSSASLPQGLALRAWTLRLSPDGQLLDRSEIPLSGPSEAGIQGGSVALNGLGSECGAVYLGLRLVGKGGEANDGLTMDDFKRSERAETGVKYSLAVEPGPATQSPEAPDGSGEIKTIRAVRTTKKTVPGKFIVGPRERWEWDFGDGSSGSGDGSDGSTVSHRFSPGKYTVRAKGVDAKGNVTDEETWEVTVPEDGTEPLSFTAGAPSPDVRVHVSGPVMWVTGKPAKFTVKVDASPSGAESTQVISVEPGREFQMVWEKPGTFEVTAAAKVRMLFRKQGSTLSMTRTYTGSLKVKVLATGVTG